MNKYITMLLLAVVAIAMVLVVTVHMNADRPVSGSTDLSSGQTDTSAVGASSGAAASTMPPIAPSAGSPVENSTANEVVLPAGALNAGANVRPTENVRSVQQSSASTAGASAETVQQPAAMPPAGQNQTAPADPASLPASSTAARTNSTAQTSGASSSPPSGTSASTPTPVTVSPGTTPRPATQPAGGTGAMRNISLHFKDKGMLIRLEADSVLAVKSFVLTAPDRLVLDLPGSWKGLKVPEIPSNTLVKKVRLGRQGNADRIVLDLTRPLRRQTMAQISERMVEVVFE